VRVVFLGGPWHEQVHEIPDGTHHWQVPVMIYTGGSDPWGEIVDHFMYRLVSYAMVPDRAPEYEIAGLLRDYLRGDP
jgi:hypothetical protein